MDNLFKSFFVFFGLGVFVAAIFVSIDGAVCANQNIRSMLTQARIACERHTIDGQHMISSRFHNNQLFTIEEYKKIVK